MTYRLATIGSALAVSAVSFASRAETPWYVSGSAGGYFRQSVTTKETFTRTAVVWLPQPVPPATTAPPPSPPGEIVVIGPKAPPPLVPVLETVRATGVAKHAYQPGENVSLALGRRLDPRLRVEVEAGYATYAAGTVKPFTASPNFPALDGRAFHLVAGGAYSRASATLNGFYDFRPKAFGLTPYVGLGMGGGETSHSTGAFVSADGARYRGLGGSAPSGLALAEAGLSIQLAPGLTLVPAYRFVRYFNANADTAHVVKASFRYTF